MMMNMMNMVPYGRSVAADPFRSMAEMERRFFEEPFGGCHPGRGGFAFRTDITDQGENYLLEADLPGFSKEDIHVDLNGENLTISAERHSDYEQKDQKGNYVRCERSYGSYSRSFDVSGIDKAAIKAGYKDGVLKLTLPKMPELAPEQRRLEIE